MHPVISWRQLRINYSLNTQTSTNILSALASEQTLLRSETKPGLSEPSPRGFLPSQAENRFHRSQWEGTQEKVVYLEGQKTGWMVTPEDYVQGPLL